MSRLGIVRHMTDANRVMDRLLPGLLIVIVLMAFGMGIMWTKLQSLEKGGAIANNAQPAAANPAAVAAPAPTEISSDQFKELIEKGDPPTLGKSNAKVTIVEFSDLQCPFCKQFADQTFSQIKKEYVDTGKVRVVFRHFPLRSIHPVAYPAALASECAKEQGKFWEYHDETYKNQASLTPDSLKLYAKTIGLNAAKFDSCLDSEKYKNLVSDDETLANGVGVNGTPAFFVNGKLISGAQPFDAFKAAIDPLL
jgi:protein-disulfide isomerase